MPSPRPRRPAANTSTSPRSSWPTAAAQAMDQRGKPAGRAMKGDTEMRPRRRRAQAERVFEGLAVAGGIAIGSAFIVDADALPVPEYHIADDAVEAEKARFAAALARSQKQIRKL